MAIGVMSGTSQDGLDLCLAKFSLSDNTWGFQIIKATTIDYPLQFKQKFSDAVRYSGEELWAFHCQFGQWIGQQVKGFTQGIDAPIDIIGSHGHTIFHKPQKGYTLQIGHGAYIAAEAGISCVSDFRSGDVARGGQGAPLVPIGDELLFSQYDFCLNIGGIANISYKHNGQRIAYDICPANMVLNHMANLLGYAMDKDGGIGRSGKVDEQLLKKLNQLDYYIQKGAKSLGREWFEQEFEPVIRSSPAETHDILRTLYEHISIQIGKSIRENPSGTLLVTGGGAHNQFLVELIKEKCGCPVIVPSKEIVDFKEALIFAFLAVLYQNQSISSLSSVTGASSNSIGGSLYF